MKNKKKTGKLCIILFLIGGGREGWMMEKQKVQQGQESELF